MRDRRSRPRGTRAPAGNRVRRSSKPPSVARPAARRTPGEGPAAVARTDAPRPTGRFTGRAIVLGVVLLALALSYVFPVRVFLAQRAEIAQLAAAQDEQRATIAELEAEAARWEDDDYVRIQARKRLFFGEPGEILLITVWDDPEDGEPETVDRERAAAQPDVWWDTLWSSVESANGKDEPQEPVDPADRLPELPEDPAADQEADS